MNLTKHWAARLEDYAIDLSWSPDGSRLAAASASGPVGVFAAADGAKLCDLIAHAEGANCVAFSPDGTALATGGQDGTVKFWDPTAGQHTATVSLGGGWVEHLAWRPAKATAEPAVQRGNAAPASAAPGFGIAEAGKGGVESLRRFVLVAAAGRKLALIHPDGSIQHTFADAPKTISAIAWEPSGGCIAAACFGSVRLWDADDFLLQKDFPYANGIHALAWSPDGRWLVSGNQDPSVHLWIPAEDAELHMSGYAGKVRHLSFDASSRLLATSGGPDASVWDCSGPGPEGREPAMLPHDAPVCAISFQHRGALLATASEDGTLEIWSPERPQPLRATIKMPAPASRLDWSPDDRLLAVGSSKGVVYILRCEA